MAVGRTLQVLSLLASGGVCILARNVMVHRYVLERAKTMQKLVSPLHLNAVGSAGASPNLKYLEASLKLEYCSLIFPVFGALLYPVYLPAALVSAALGCISALVMDSYLTIRSTQILLKTVNDALVEENGVTSHAQGYKSMQQTKCMTLAGSTIMIASSMVLNVMCILFFTLGDHGNPFYASPWLNAFVFWINADSVFNSVGMVFLCGVLKRVPLEALRRRFCLFRAHQSEPAKKDSSFKFESKACDQSSFITVPAAQFQSHGQAASSLLGQGSTALSVASSEYGM